MRSNMEGATGSVGLSVVCHFVEVLDRFTKQADVQLVNRFLADLQKKYAQNQPACPFVMPLPSGAAVTKVTVLVVSVGAGEGAESGLSKLAETLKSPSVSAITHC